MGNYGEALSLQNKFEYSDKPNEVVESAVEKGAARRRADEKQLVSDLDFKVDYKNLLPVYGKAIANEQATLLNNYARYRQQDSRTAYNKIQLDALQAKQKIGAWMTSNAAAKEYLAQDASHRRNDQLVAALVDSNTTFDNLKQFNDGYFTQIGQNGEFGYRGVKSFNIGGAVKLDKDADYERNFPTGKTRPSKIAEHKYVEVQDRILPGAIAREATALSTNPQFIDDVLYQFPEARKLPRDQQIKFIYDFAEAAVTKVAPPGGTEWKHEQIPRPPQGDSESKKKPISIQENVQVTMVDPSTEKPTTKTIPYQVNTPNAKEITIQNNEEILDVETNKPITNDPRQFKFKATNLQLIPVKHKDGTTTREWYAIGQVVDNAEVPAPPVDPGENASEAELKEYDNAYNEWNAKYGKTKPGSRQTTYSAKVPLNIVRGSVEEVYDISTLDGLKQKQDEARPLKSGGGTYNIKGTKYTLKQLTDMGYTPEQVAPYLSK